MKSYEQYCGVAKSLDIVGERWTLLIVRDLILGAKSYTTLLNGLVGITTNLLAKRLRDMQGYDLIIKANSRYGLTKRGRQLERVVFALGKWGTELLDSKGDERKSLHFFMVSFKRRFLPMGRNWSLSIESDVGSFSCFEKAGKVEVLNGANPAANVSVSGSEKQVLAFLNGGASLLKLKGGVEIDGNKRELKKILAQISKR